MTPPKTIDSGTRDYADALDAAEAARRHAREALELRQAAAFYLGDGHGLGRYEASLRADACRLDASGHAEAEALSLRRLNAVLLRHGQPGEEFVVGRGIYRACNPGRMAAYLGVEPPGFEEIVRAFEPMDVPDDPARDEIAGRAAEYAELVRIPD